MISTFRKGGVHPPQHKEASRSIDLQPLPMTAYLPLSQHIGAPSTAIVERGQHVVRGQLVAESASFVSACLHAPVTGTVTAIEQSVLPSGIPTLSIVIKASDEDHEADTLARVEYWQKTVPALAADRLSGLPSAEDIRRIISAAGIVGLGGATFPSHVKLSVKPEQKPEVLIINGCECEPYLMCDDAMMNTWSGCIVDGALLMMRACGASHTVIAMEDNKPEAARAIAGAIGERSDVSLRVLKTKYPQGGEKQLVEAVTGRRIASGALPLSVGAVVHNVATTFAVWQAVVAGMPLVERVVTVTGDIPEAQRRNYIAAIGTPLSEFEFTLPKEARVVIGGPMMGRTAVRLDAPVMKGTSGVTVLSGKSRRKVQPCVRCGACVDACPMGLQPYLISTYGRLRMFDEARDAHVADCLECGACSYSCPSSRPILDYIRIAKQRTRK